MFFDFNTTLLDGRPVYVIAADESSIEIECVLTSDDPEGDVILLSTLSARDMFHLHLDAGIALAEQLQEVECMDYDKTEVA